MTLLETRAVRALRWRPALAVVCTAAVLTFGAARPSAGQSADSATAADAIQFETQALMDEVRRLTPADLPALRSRAEAGDARSQVMLGLVYEVGVAEIRPQPVEALTWFLQAAAQGVAWAESWSADFYFFGGTGVERDVARARDLYMSAARHGDSRAAFAVAQMYFQGEGVPIDHGEAAAWFRRGAAADPELAARMVDLAQAPCRTVFCVSLRRIVGALMTGWADRFAAEWSESAREWSSDITLPGTELCGFTSSDRTVTGDIRNFFCDTATIADETRGSALATELAGQVEAALPSGFTSRTSNSRPGPSTLLLRDGYPRIRITYNLTPGAAQHRVTLIIGG